jgi:hypothetical protein
MTSHDPRQKQIVDSLDNYAKRYADSAAQVMARGDDSLAVYARNLVLSTLTELFRWEYRRTPWASGELISIGPYGVSEGAREYGWLELGHVGNAGIVADGSMDVPTADVEGAYNTARVHTVATSIVYSTQDLRASSLQGMFDIASEKVAAAREAYDREINRLILEGEQTKGLSGVLTVGGLSTVATTGNWATATPSQIVADFTQAVDEIFVATDTVESPDTAVFPSEVWTRITTLQNSIASDITVLDYLKRAFPEITLWTYDGGLPDSTAVVYSRDKSRIRCVMPMVLRPTPLEQRGLSFRMAFESRFGGVVAMRPRARCLLTGI